MGSKGETGADDPSPVRLAKKKIIQKFYLNEIKHITIKMYYLNFILEIAFSKKRTQNRINVYYILTKQSVLSKWKK